MNFLRTIRNYLISLLAILDKRMADEYIRLPVSAFDDLIALTELKDVLKAALAQAEKEVQNTRLVFTLPTADAKVAILKILLEKGRTGYGQARTAFLKEAGSNETSTEMAFYYAYEEVGELLR